MVDEFGDLLSAVHDSTSVGEMATPSLTRERELELLKPYVGQFVGELISPEGKPFDPAEFLERLNSFRESNISSFRAIGMREEAGWLGLLNAAAVFKTAGEQITIVEKDNANLSSTNPSIARANEGTLARLKLVRDAASAASDEDGSKGRYDDI